MAPPTTTTSTTDKRREKSTPGPSAIDRVDVHVSPQRRLRSLSVGSKLGQQQQAQVLNTTNSIPKKTQLAKCPCLISNEKSWKIKCCQCKQVWHTACSNLNSKTLTDKILAELEKDWACPWCFVAPFLRPSNHPSVQNESKLFGTVVAGVISDTVAEAVEECLTVKTTEIQLSIDKSVTEAVNVQMQRLNSEMEKLQLKKEEKKGKSYPSAPLTTEVKTNPTNHIEDYVELFLKEEDALELKETLAALQFTKVKGREISSFGEQYSYTGAPNNNTKEIPVHLTKLIEKIKEIEDYKDVDLNQVIINKYEGNTSYLPEHSDNESTIRPQSKIFTISIGSERTVLFRDKCSETENELTVPNGSLYVMAQESQNYWTHRIDKEESAEDTRYSITFRCVGANFKNSTLILGDSNTKYLKFGTGVQGEKGTFGYHLPGNRMETYHIRDIDPRKCLGYQNVLLHCGINDIRDKSPGRLASEQVMQNPQM